MLHTCVWKAAAVGRKHAATASQASVRLLERNDKREEPGIIAAERACGFLLRVGDVMLLCCRPALLRLARAVWQQFLSLLNVPGSG